MQVKDAIQKYSTSTLYITNVVDDAFRTFTRTQ